eukprot:scaffold73723_cov67-Attheya_sp.AAC.6
MRSRSVHQSAAASPLSSVSGSEADSSSSKQRVALSIPGTKIPNQQHRLKKDNHKITFSSFFHCRKMKDSFGFKVLAVTFYVASGVVQPLLMTVTKEAGLADPKCQLYMLFYYLGPSSVGAWVWYHRKDYYYDSLSSWINIWPAMGIAVFDIAAQSLNYTGSTMAGPTLFGILYSSVTVWTAIYSRLFLNRTLSPTQWISIGLVFGGMALAALGSQHLGPQVGWGTLFIIIGSSVHAMTYVLSEYVMTTKPFQKEGGGSDKVRRGVEDGNGPLLLPLPVEVNCAIQGGVAVAMSLTWQMVYTWSHFSVQIGEPMKAAGTTVSRAALILGGLAVVNFIHALSFFYTLAHVHGGAVSAGLGKALQAVLVFGATQAIFCGKVGGSEMCFTTQKCASLVVVVSGILLYGYATQQQQQFLLQSTKQSLGTPTSTTALLSPHPTIYDNQIKNDVETG